MTEPNEVLTEPSYLEACLQTLDLPKTIQYIQVDFPRETTEKSRLEKLYLFLSGINLTETEQDAHFRTCIDALEADLTGEISRGIDTEAEIQEGRYKHYYSRPEIFGTDIQSPLRMVLRSLHSDILNEEDILSKEDYALFIANLLTNLETFTELEEDGCSNSEFREVLSKSEVLNKAPLSEFTRRFCEKKFLEYLMKLESLVEL